MAEHRADRPPVRRTGSGAFPSDWAALADQLARVERELAEAGSSGLDAEERERLSRAVRRAVSRASAHPGRALAEVEAIRKTLSDRSGRGPEGRNG